MKITRIFAALPVLLLALVACTTTGSGGGQLAGPGAQEEPVAFSWTSTDGGMSGAMTAALPNASYQGRFFQITQQTRGEVLTPLWTHWNRGWYDWPYWSGPEFQPYPATQFITFYSGKVVATLESPGNQRMRCRFHLVEPVRGMSGGGEGQCQLSDGRLVRATFPGK
ncbi:hypothetical protein Rfer_0381 [Rhodoferax ferrireducens T118]|uniref:Lipoprotein n=1 Tax=Albidiferax ferrireducens (strain ATCC BAA-621 / DSM 15236 / T118) TaxID=338969 RepID=Q222B8_ALBFT|nr:hypothetical protein [Rhodoferax ferrireducens]ABD68135.1 hypothetical protein Rfer_0381 [Rhodoferax ferrireducens T118]